MKNVLYVIVIGLLLVGCQTVKENIKIEVEDIPFSPDNDGINDVINITFTGFNIKKYDAYNISILDPKNNIFKTFTPKDLVNNRLTWDGKSDSGELVQSASIYPIIVESIGAKGNKIIGTNEIPVDIIIFKDGNKLKIVISSIIFKANTPDYINIDTEIYEKNIETLNRLSEVLKKYSTYSIILEGHAVRTFWDSSKKWMLEEKDKLLPLSINRAQVIKAALVELGVREERMSIDGFGGYEPVVPHSDLENRWKNRRVEFILIK